MVPGGVADRVYRQQVISRKLLAEQEQKIEEDFDLFDYGALRAERRAPLSVTARGAAGAEPVEVDVKRSRGRRGA
eukprot:9751478-Heterocapsa_arctica.AAC.1